MRTGRVIAVAKDGEHRFSKQLVAEVTVIAGYGIEGDAHEGLPSNIARASLRIRRNPIFAKCT